jgi:hypothetical protein
LAHHFKPKIGGAENTLKVGCLGIGFKVEFSVGRIRQLFDGGVGFLDFFKIKSGAAKLFERAFRLA